MPLMNWRALLALVFGILLQLLQLYLSSLQLLASAMLYLTLE